MWPFRKKPASPPEEALKPIEILLSRLVLDVLGKLTADDLARMDAMAPRLQQSLKTAASDWRGILFEALHLRPTFEIAVLDLWYRNAAAFTASHGADAVQGYAVHFAREYGREGSQIDVWPEGTLDAAKARIAAARAKEARA